MASERRCAANPRQCEKNTGPKPRPVKCAQAGTPIHYFAGDCFRILVDPSLAKTSWAPEQHRLGDYLF